MSRDDLLWLDGPPDDDPTAALLRDVLHRQADAVRPSPDGLRRIRAEIARDPRRVLPVRGRRHLTPLVAAAAAAVVVAAGATFTVRAVTHRGPSTVSVATIAQMVDRHEVEEAPAASLPVYVAARENGKVVLFREFRQVGGAGGVDDRVAQAVELALTGRPLDPDYTQLFAATPVPNVTAKVTAGRIDLDISPAPRASSITPTWEEARVAVQQLLWTATATATVAARSAPPGSPAVAGTVPPGGRRVRITLDGRSDVPFFGRYSLDRDLRREVDPSLDPRAKAWIIDPAENAPLHGRLDAAGDAVAIGEASVFVRLSRDGVVVRQEVVPLVASEASGGSRPPLAGQRGTWRIDGWDVSAPGRYELAVYAPTVDAPPADPGGTSPDPGAVTGAGPGTAPATDAADAVWWDTRSFTVS